MKSFLKTLPAALCCALLIFMTGPSPAAANPATDPIVDELRGDLDLGYFDRYWGELEEEARRYMPELSPEGLMERVRSGERLFDPAELFSGIGRFFFGEVLLNLKLMGQLLLLAVAAAFLKNLESAFERRQVATLTRSIVFLVLLGICLFSFKAVLQLAGKTIDNMVDFSLASLPALTALLAAQGSVVSSALFHPLIVFGINFFGTFISRVIFPLIFFSAVLGLVDHFSPHFKVSRLSDLFKELSTWALGISMTVFVGILTVQGAAGTVADAVSLRTAKYMTGAFIPVVGKVLSDAVETVAGASIILKNSIYLTGVALLLLLTLFPLLKVAAIALIYKLSAALVEPLGEGDLGSCINVMGNSLVLILAALASVGVIFFLAVTALVGAGNIAIMFR
ncbi:MAG TPA: stage III sporulation protein AE [Firmicutes bacterium]|nr:stage III sporulation protein AE [Bacillota bacterium]